MDKKKIFAILLFLIMGFFMFTAANPVNDGLKPLNNDNNQNNQNNNTNNKNDKIDTTPAVVAPVLENKQVVRRNLTIEYKYAKTELGNIAANYNAQVEVGKNYNVVSPVVEYYTADKLVVAGKMGNANTLVTVLYTPVNDENKNGLADELEAHYTITYLGADDVEVEKFENILVGLPTPKPADPIKESYIFARWNPEVAEKVTGDATYRAIYLEDFNENGEDDATEAHYTIKYIDQDGAILNEFKNVLVGTETPTVVAPVKPLLVFVGWNPNVATHVTADATYQANYADDKNNNGIIDSTEAHYTITYVDSDDTIIEKFENVLVDTVTPIIENPKKEGYIFNGWEPFVEGLVTNDATYKATYLEDKNNNNIPDDQEDKYTIRYLVDGVEYAKFENVLVGLATPKPADPIKVGYVFKGWNPEVAEKVTGDAEYTADFKSADNTNYTVITKIEQLDGTFKETNEELTGTTDTVVTIDAPLMEGFTFNAAESKLSGVIAADGSLELVKVYNRNKYTIKYLVDGALHAEGQFMFEETVTLTVVDPVKPNYKFIGWEGTVATMPAHDVEVTAKFEALQTGLKVLEKPNIQMVFTQGHTYKISDYIIVKAVFADGKEVEVNNYTTDFTTANIVADKVLTVTHNGFENKDIKYTVKVDIAHQTKFEVINDVAATGYRRSIKTGFIFKTECTSNCDTLENTELVETDKKFIEIVEHYEQNVILVNVAVKYKGATNFNTLNVIDTTYDKSGRVRWSYRTGSFLTSYRYFDPVYVYEVTNRENIDLVRVTYERDGFGKFEITFKYDGNKKLVAIDEVNMK